MSYTFTDHALGFFSAFTPWFIALGGLIVLALLWSAWPWMLSFMKSLNVPFYPWRVALVHNCCKYMSLWN